MSYPLSKARPTTAWDTASASARSVGRRSSQAAGSGWRGSIRQTAMRSSATIRSPLGSGVDLQAQGERPQPRLSRNPRVSRSLLRELLRPDREADRPIEGGFRELPRGQRREGPVPPCDAPRRLGALGEWSGYIQKLY